jgi:hypothetical protein
MRNTAPGLMASSAAVLSSLASLLTLGGCATSQGSAKAMYAAQYQCPEDRLEYENLGGYKAIMVRGCGYEQLYACTHDSTCIRDGERRPIGGSVPAPPPEQ